VAHAGAGAGALRAAGLPALKLGPYVERIAQILAEDRTVPEKQRHTAQRIFERLVEEGYSGGYTQVREKVRQLRRLQGEVFMPLLHDPGTAQVDVGQALVRQGGVLRKVYFFVLVLPHSDALFVQAFEHACTEMFWEFHRRAPSPCPRQCQGSRPPVFRTARHRRRAAAQAGVLSRTLSGRPLATGPAACGGGRSMRRLSSPRSKRAGAARSRSATAPGGRRTRSGRRRPPPTRSSERFCKRLIRSLLLQRGYSTTHEIGQAIEVVSITATSMSSLLYE